MSLVRSCHGISLKNLRSSISSLALALIVMTTVAVAQPATPVLTGAVNDFANIIDPGAEAELERRINALMNASGDVVVVATVPNIEGYADIKEFAVKMFENSGRGVGQKDKDNGLLIVVALAERKAAIEVGYDLEQFVTDGAAGAVIRERMLPEFRGGNYGAGLVNGATALINRIAQGRGVQLDGVPVPSAPARQRRSITPSCWPFLLIFIVFMLVNRGGGRRRRRWGGSGWSSGVGPFGGGLGGGFGGGFGGGGFGGGGGGFGGFGGGSSGGGGASGSW